MKNHDVKRTIYSNMNITTSPMHNIQWLILRVVLFIVSLHPTWCSCSSYNPTYPTTNYQYNNYSSSNNNLNDVLISSSDVHDRITKVIEILSSHQVVSKSTTTMTEDAIYILTTIQDDLVAMMLQQQQQQQQHLPCSTNNYNTSSSMTTSTTTTTTHLPRQSQQSRRLEDGQDTPDDDYYFSYYNIYRNNKNSDVSVSYDDEDNTVVTVGDDVIVLVEHEFGFYLYNGGMVILCIVIGATMAGLLMGIMSLDPLLVSVKARTASSDEDRKRAMALLPYVQNKNLVLVSLLIVNCGTNEALPVFLDTLLETPWLTVLISLTVVLVVGEILPSSYFTGRDQVKSACDLIPVLRFVIIVTSPVSYPLAKLMDHYFHQSAEVSTFKRGEITAIVRIQYEEHLAWKRRQAAAEEYEASIKANETASIASMKSFSKHCDSFNPCHALSIFDDTDIYTCVQNNAQCNGLIISPTQSMHQDLGNDDIIKLEGALTLKDKTVEQVYTPMRRVISVLADAVLDENMIVKIYSYGFSRIPVMGRIDNDTTTTMSTTFGICGIILTKQLMLIGKDDQRRASSLTIYEPPCISPQTSLADALNIILSGKRKSSNMAIVCHYPDLARTALRHKQPIPNEAGVMGIITLENVLEELLQEQIFDEKDRKLNPSMERAKWVIAKWKAFVLQRRIERDEENILNTEHPFDYIKMNEIL